MISLHHRMAGFVLAAALLTAAPAIAVEATPPSARNIELARHLFAGMHMDRIMDGMMRNIVPVMTAQARKANPQMTDAQADVITDAVAESSKDMMGKMVDRMVPLYASTFTEKELQDLVAFYDGPSGQAMLAKMPQLMAQMTPVMTDLMPAMMADVRQRICAKVDCTKVGPPPAPTH